MPRPVLAVVRGVRQRPLQAEGALDLKARLAAICRDVPGAADVLPALQAVVDRETTPSDRWDFLMTNFREMGHVMRLIRTQAKRPMLSFAIWEQMAENLDPQTGVLLLSREALAARVGSRANHVSSALAEFVAWNVLLRYTSGRSALWRLNPNIATMLPAAAGEAARKAAGPVLRLVSDSGRVDDARQPELV